MLDAIVTFCDHLDKCITVADTLGPYLTEADCITRTKQMLMAFVEVDVLKQWLLSQFIEPAYIQPKLICTPSGELF